MCGIVGLIGTPDAAREAFLGLTTLQHRGQDAAGILSYDADGFHRVKNLGLVESVFTRENVDGLTGTMAVGHARYSTIGKGDLADVQPFLISYPYGIGMVHNGNIVNVSELAQDLKTRARRHLLTHSDTEVVLNFFAEGLANSKCPESPDLDNPFETICESISEIYKRVNGSYSIITLIADQGLVAFRDPHGIRPLIWGKNGNAHCLASESVALNILNYEIVRDIAPGEVIFIDMKGKVHTRVLDARPARHCMFEWVYFASPESEMDEVPVYGTRIQLGRSLGKLLKKQIEERKIEADIIVPVPETSRIAAIALAEELGIPYREVLIKNRYIKRTFILDSQEKRQKAVNLKLSPVRSEIEGKRVILVDDSIVRGTTSKKIIELVRKAGASKVFFVSTCPPIKHPCYYGIDFPVEGELIASGRSISEVRDALGADEVIYQDVEGLKQAIHAAQLVAHPAKGKPSGLCTACLDGCYPTNVTAPGNQIAAGRKADRLTARREGA
jgi:amidophosphoribosyltransferase